MLLNIEDSNSENDDTKDGYYYEISTLYHPNLNNCVDAILENKPNHLDMMRQMEKLYNCSKRDLEQNKFIIRHRTKMAKRYK